MELGVLPNDAGFPLCKFTVTSSLPDKVPISYAGACRGIFGYFGEIRLFFLNVCTLIGGESRKSVLHFQHIALCGPGANVNRPLRSSWRPSAC